MEENKETGEVSTLKTHPLNEIEKYVKKYADIEEVIEFSLPSPQITPQHMMQLAHKINSINKKYHGVVITHGTDTLEETAYFLDLVIEATIPVIVTGAMRSYNEIGSDALYNIISSVRVATSKNARNKGVLVVMNDEIHHAGTVTKTSTSNVATFQSPQYGPVGIITKEKVIFHHSLLEKRLYPIKKVNKRVYLITAVAGMESDILQAIHKLKPDGLIIEGLGQGNLPKGMIKQLDLLLKDDIPIVLVSRCYQGVVQPIYNYIGGGSQLKDMGLIFTNGLTGPKARIKLMIALEYTSKLDTIHQIFEDEII